MSAIFSKADVETPHLDSVFYVRFRPADVTYLGVKLKLFLEEGLAEALLVSSTQTCGFAPQRTPAAIAGGAQTSTSTTWSEALKSPSRRQPSVRSP